MMMFLGEPEEGLQWNRHIMNENVLIASKQKRHVARVKRTWIKIQLWIPFRCRPSEVSSSDGARAGGRVGDGSIKCCQRGDIPRPKPRCVIATPRKMFILCLHCYLWPLSLTYCGPLPPSGCVTLIILPLALYVIQNSFCKWQAMNNRYNLFSQLRWVYDVDADIDS